VDQSKAGRKESEVYGMKKAIYHYDERLHTRTMPYRKAIKISANGKIVDVLRKEHIINKNIFIVNCHKPTLATFVADESELEFIND
jgi:hypothetical protein